MKIVRNNQLVPYQAKGHYNMLAQRIHSKEISNSEMLTIGLSWFLPGGGAEFNTVGEGMELVYYIIEGTMTLTTDKETVPLNAGDSCLFKPGDGRAIKNDSTHPAAMLVIAAKK
ncbi:MAG: cupin domain-containing protein [Dehalococcoidales bacterium]|nr:cupin domain-containing protein [Dehalococcoidales bacterium]